MTEPRHQNPVKHSTPLLLCNEHTASTVHWLMYHPAKKANLPKAAAFVSTKLSS